MATRHARGGTLVIGGGYAGGYVARLLGRSGATIVGPENFMLFTPLLPEAASGPSSRVTSWSRCGRCAPMQSSCSAA
jgi:NADH dehydrogenase FAD-containing subunit